MSPKAKSTAKSEAGEPFDDRRVRAIARALSTWFDTHARDLPWRHTRDPYAVWVSEIMLQQTRVETVERYWGDFLDRFPDVGTLAAADEHEVLEQWSGLGYYRRARLLHRGARHVHGELGGELPGRADELRAIPGVGPYTAGAIASIAFDEPAALVDGNVARVHARLAAIEEPALQDAKAKAHWRFVERVLEHGSPRVLAQALMELGATVCTPKSPKCLLCPVRRHCRAHAAGKQALIPAAKLKKKSPEQHWYALALRWGDRLLLERRGDEGLLAGMWCLPLFPRPAGRRPKGAALQEQGEVLVGSASEALGVPLRLSEAPDGAVKHVFSHRVWHLLPWQARARRAPKIKSRADGRTLAWLSADEAPTGGVPTLTRKLLQAIGESARAPL